MAKPLSLQADLGSERMIPALVAYVNRPEHEGAGLELIIDTLSGTRICGAMLAFGADWVMVRDGKITWVPESAIERIRLDWY